MKRMFITIYKLWNIKKDLMQYAYEYHKGYTIRENGKLYKPIDMVKEFIKKYGVK